MFQNYNNYLSPRQKSLLARLRKMQGRIQRKIKDGSFAKMSRRQRQKLLNRLRRYALKLEQLGYTLRIGAAGSALALALSLTNPATAQTFTEQTGSSNPFNGVDVGSVSTTSFVDVDGDGGMDAFIGEYAGNINYFQNTGTVQSHLHRADRLQ